MGFKPSFKSHTDLWKSEAYNVKMINWQRRHTWIFEVFNEIKTQFCHIKESIFYTKILQRRYRSIKMRGFMDPKPFDWVAITKRSDHDLQAHRQWNNSGFQNFLFLLTLLVLETRCTLGDRRQQKSPDMMNDLLQPLLATLASCLKIFIIEVSVYRNKIGEFHGIFTPISLL